MMLKCSEVAQKSPLGKVWLDLAVVVHVLECELS